MILKVNIAAAVLKNQIKKIINQLNQLQLC